MEIENAGSAKILYVKKEVPEYELNEDARFNSRNREMVNEFYLKDFESRLFKIYFETFHENLFEFINYSEKKQYIYQTIKNSFFNLKKTNGNLKIEEIPDKYFLNLISEIYNQK